MEEKKKRGRKKKSINSDENNEDKNNEDKNNEDINNVNENQQIIIKKRGRKKKWEVETKTKLLENIPLIFDKNENNNNNTDIDNENYEQNHISFGNLNIKVHKNKDTVNIDDIKNILQNNDNTENNTINISNSKKEINKIISLRNSNENKIEKLNKTENVNGNVLSSKLIKIKEKKNIDRQIKILKHFEDQYSSGKEIITSDYRCYYCHHTFPNKPFFLPTDYSSELNRYKVFGNFCSPNCVKSYALNHKIYSNKAYLVGQMYRKLMGNINIKCAPPIQCLKEYGGIMSISEFRDTFDLNYNKTYSINLLNCKIVYEEINVRSSY